MEARGALSENKELKIDELVVEGGSREHQMKWNLPAIGWQREPDETVSFKQ